ncbi:hypothetical protein BDQ17DRAFT_1406994 [Cyathus striatus]|nr:hypothetical protein BDQ17DRAFT_1406994 [Cyathus striatus]
MSSFQHLPISYKLPRLRSSFGEQNSECYDDSGQPLNCAATSTDIESNYIITEIKRTSANYNMVEDDTDFDHDQAQEDALNRALKSSPRDPRPSLPSFKDVLRSLDIPVTTAETRNDAKWKDIARPSSASRTVSFFNCPKATYMWPTFQSNSHADTAPILYVGYSHSRKDVSVDNILPEVLNRTNSPDTEPRAQDSRDFDSDFHMKHSPSPSYSSRSYRLATRSPSPFIRANKVSRPSDFRELSLPDRSPSLSDSYASSFSTDNFDSRSASQLSISEASQNWEEYTRISTNTDGKIEYECLWPHSDDPMKTCGFKRKKQGVKRHVEAKHLGIRRHVCSYCGQAFSTKLTVDCHTWRKHTGEKPLPCRYGCGKSFNDPARQFRHYESAHGYVSVHPRKKTKLDSS